MDLVMARWWAEQVLEYVVAVLGFLDLVSAGEYGCPDTGSWFPIVPS